MIMKKIFYLIAATALAGGLSGCGTKEPEAVKTVDLRYRVENSYSLEAVSPKAFTILVASTDPWTVRSEHPDWCIIDIEEGDASDAALLHAGKAEATTVRVQYYDNTGLDDREDVIEIKSDYWVGKRVAVHQKGIAYLYVPDEEQDFAVTKAGGDLSFRVRSNQNWTSAVIEGDWIAVKEGAEGSQDGTVTVTAGANAGEQRYAAVAVYDRHGEERAVVKFTQDGVQLEPSEQEVRTTWDQGSYEIPVRSNVSWTAAGGEGDTWYTIENPENTGDATLRLRLENNTGTGIRDARIVLKSVAAEGEYVAVKEIWLRQAYQMLPVRVPFDADQIASWSVTSNSTWTGTPAFDGTGMLLQSPTQIKRTMDPPGSYVFHWSGIGASSRIRLWYVYSGQEIKYNMQNGSTDISISSAAGTLPDKKNASYDPSVAHDMGVSFSPIAGGYCHVAFLLDGEEFYGFDTSETLGAAFAWGKDVDLYLGVDTGDSAVCEWYEYTQPFSWDE